MFSVCVCYEAALGAAGIGCSGSSVWHCGHRTHQYPAWSERAPVGAPCWLSTICGLNSTPNSDPRQNQILQLVFSEGHRLSHHSRCLPPTSSVENQACGDVTQELGVPIVMFVRAYLDHNPRANTSYGLLHAPWKPGGAFTQGTGCAYLCVVYMKVCASVLRGMYTQEPLCVYLCSQVCTQASCVYLCSQACVSVLTGVYTQAHVCVSMLRCVSVLTSMYTEAHVCVSVLMGVCICAHRHVHTGATGVCIIDMFEGFWDRETLLC